MAKKAAPVGEMTARFDLMSFTDTLIADLNDLRAGKISTKEAMARAELARQVLRSVQLVVQARKFLEAAALPAPSVKS
jgi:hypothetical protein